MNGQEERWFVKFRGHTLGPLNSQQIKISIQKRELCATDKIASAVNPVWKEIREEGAFQNFFSTPAQTLPSPSTLLLKKKKVEIPKSPKLEEKESEERVIVNPQALAETTEVPLANATKKHGKTIKSKPNKKSSAKSGRMISPKTEIPKAVSPKSPKSPLPSTREDNIDLVSTTPAPSATTPPVDPIPTETPVNATSTPTKPISDPKIIREALLETFPQKPLLPPAGASIGERGSDANTLIGLWNEWKDFDPPLDPIDPPKLSTKRASHQQNEILKDSLYSENLGVDSTKTKTIQIQITLSKAWIALFFLCGMSLFAAGLFYLQSQKTRDLKDLHLSDPSSPTIQPSTPDDPIPSLKAPTRPKRE